MRISEARASRPRRCGGRADVRRTHRNIVGQDPARRCGESDGGVGATSSAADFLPARIEDPLLHVDLGPAPGALTLTPHARVRDTCEDAADESVRTMEPVRIAP